jgi:hypothetical protein
MDPFAVVALCCGLAVVLVFVAIGKYYPGSGADVLDWKPTRSMETEIELELEDIDQMIEAQNERRRRTGRPERNEDDVRAEIEAAERELKARREAYQRSQGGGDPPNEG